jgi:hypothetical protein
MDPRIKSKDPASLPKVVACGLVWSSVCAVVFWLTWCLAPGPVAAQADPNRQGFSARGEPHGFPWQHQSDEPTELLELPGHEASHPVAHPADSLGLL